MRRSHECHSCGVAATNRSTFEASNKPIVAHVPVFPESVRTRPSCRTLVLLNQHPSSSGEKCSVAGRENHAHCDHGVPTPQDCSLDCPPRPRKITRRKTPRFRCTRVRGLPYVNWSLEAGYTHTDRIVLRQRHARRQKQRWRIRC